MEESQERNKYLPRKRLKKSKRDLVINFDVEARKCDALLCFVVLMVRREFLTGFHKRRQERKKKAQEEIKRKARKAFLETRQRVCFVAPVTPADRLQKREELKMRHPQAFKLFDEQDAQQKKDGDHDVQTEDDSEASKSSGWSSSSEDENAATIRKYEGDNTVTTTIVRPLSLTESPPPIAAPKRKLKEARRGRKRK
jgi:ribosomal RNA-processing protein 17